MESFFDTVSREIDEPFQNILLQNTSTQLIVHPGITNSDPRYMSAITNAIFSLDDALRIVKHRRCVLGSMSKM